MQGITHQTLRAIERFNLDWRFDKLTDREHDPQLYRQSLIDWGTTWASVKGIETLAKQQTS